MKYASSRLAAFYEQQQGRASASAAPIHATTAKLRPAPRVPIAKPATPESVKARADAVLASPVCKGREKQAHALLMASCDKNPARRTSAAIIAELGKRCSDAELERRTKAYNAAKAQAGMAGAFANANSLVDNMRARFPQAAN